MRYRNLIITFLSAGLVFAGSVFVAKQNLYAEPASVAKKNYKFHTQKEVVKFKDYPTVLSPIDSGEYFLHSENCRTCHGHDSANYANIDYSGNDVNLFDDWEATMMANAAKDPLWRAKVSHEILVNPSHSNELQNKCTSCHAPQGHYTSFFKGNPFYTIADLENDSLGLNGVACVGCHTISSNGLGTTFSGIIPYDTMRVMFGPFQNPNSGPMQLYTGFTPSYSAHMDESRACSPCHTLITNSADLSGIPTGKTFVEQATFHEWQNSAFPSDNITCQNCHMPKVLDSIRIANGYLNLPPRSPFNRHKFMGGNAFMLELIKNNKTKLGITVPDEHFDSSIAITKKNIRYNSVDLAILQDSITNDTAFYRVRLSNKAGHKFPSGYPSRRAVLQFVLVATNGDTLFKSGIFDANGEVAGIGSPYEAHYTMINSQNQNQVYEMVMGDVTGTKTTVLERADTILKDNRIPPEGFSSSASMYDTVKIMGDAVNDPDFNKFSGGAEGSGRDFVHFHIAVAGFPSAYNVYARFWYQTVPPGWLQEMFSYSSAPIDSFKTMYNAAAKPPLLVDADSIMNVLLAVSKNKTAHEITIGPDPCLDGNVTLFFKNAEEVSLVRVTNMSGQVISTLRPGGLRIEKMPVKLPEEKGAYLVEVFIDQERISLKVIRQ
jgi:hypothetical protein